MPERGFEELARQVPDMVRDALANQERGKILGEVVAIMKKEVIGLQALDPKSCR